MSLALVAAQCQNVPGVDLPLSAASSELGAEVVPVALINYQTCDDLLEDIKAEALEQVGPYGFDSGGGFIEPFAVGASVPEASFDSAVAGDALESQAAAAPAAPPVAGVDFSDTNVQVAGVDEADIVKTNGELVIGLSRSARTVWVTDVTSEVPRLIGKLGLTDGYYQEMFLIQDKLILIGNSDRGITPFDNSGTVASSSQSADASTSFLRSYEQNVIVTEVDLSDPTDPEATRHLRIEGSYVSSRAANGFARVVVRTMPESKLGLVRPGSSTARSLAIAERLNRQLVQDSTISQWLPEYSLNDDLGSLIDSGSLTSCNRAYAPEQFFGFNQLSVVSLALDEALQVADSTSVRAEGQTVYASLDNLYVSHVVRDFSFFEDSPQDLTEETIIHKFALGQDGTTQYRGSGAAVGQPLNQFAFHEYQGRLFVATTLFSRDFDDRESFVTVLEDQGNRLAIIDKVGNLGRGESIFAVRYIADKAYVVTFRQTDPLYVVDLSDPTNLSTEGELKITGYSAYLHPVGDDLLLGVGREATDTGRVTGAKVTLFDVSDPTDPRDLDSVVLEGGSSEVEWDQKAFLWWAPESLAVVPINNYRTDFYGAIAVRVRQTGDSYSLTLDEKISHERATLLTGDRSGCDWYQPLSTSFAPSNAIVKVCPPEVQELSGSEARAFGAPDSYRCFNYDLESRETDEVLPERADSLVSADDIGSAAELQAALADLDGSESGRVHVCAPEFTRTSRIIRSLIIHDDLWTLSDSVLQANELDSLNRRAWVAIPG